MWMKNNLEFDDEQRKDYRFTRFCKRKLLFDPINIEDLVDIPYIYRFRFYGFINCLMTVFIQEYNERLRTLNNLGIKDKTETKYLYESQLNEIKNDLCNNIKTSSETICLPFVVDIRKYDPSHITDNCFGINETYFNVFVSNDTLKRLKNLRKVIGNEEKIKQMLESSKIVADSYKKYKMK